MEKQENRLVQIFEELRAAGICANRTDFAKALGYDRTTVSSAMNGAARAYTPTLVAKAEQLRREQLNGEPQVREPKQIVIPEETLELYNNLSRAIEKQAEIIEALLGEKQQKKRAE